MLEAIGVAFGVVQVALVVWAYRAHPAAAARYPWWVVLGIAIAPWPLDLGRFVDADDVGAFERYRYRRLLQTYVSLLMAFGFAAVVFHWLPIG